MVDAGATQKLIGRWGGPVMVFRPEMMPGDDPESHVIAGRIMSPGATPQVVQVIVEWLTSRF